jgi:hypothetical protein
LHLPENADGHADHGDAAAADHACADADGDADRAATGRSGASSGDRHPSSDGLT